MARLPTVASVPQANPGTLRAPAVRGPAVPQGNALGNIAETVSDINERAQLAAAKVQSREDTIRRVRALGDFDAFGASESERLRTEADLTDPNTLTTFGSMLREDLQRRAGELQGSEESRQLFLARGEERINARAQALGKLVNEAQKSLLDREYQTMVRQELTDIEPSVEGVLDKIGRLQQRSSEFAGGFSEAEEAANLMAAQEAAVLAAVNPLIDAGGEDNILVARSILDRPEVVAVIPPATRRKLETRIRGDEARARAGVREGQEKLRQAATILGVSVDDLTPDQRRQVAGMDKQDLDDLQFGKGMQGRANAIVTNNAVAFANNLLSEQEEREFLAAVNILTQPRGVPNPDTGVVEIIQPQLPVFVTDALRAREMADLIPQQRRTGPPTAEELRTGRRLPPQGGSVTAPASAPTTAPGPVSEAPGEEGAPSNISVFDMVMRGDVAGPVPALQRGVSRIPLVGDIFSEQTAPAVMAQTITNQLTRDLVRTLQNNPRFSEAERQAIQADVTLEGEVFDTPTAFINRMIGMDVALEQRQENAMRTAMNQFVARDERRAAMNIVNALSNFRESLGLPPRIRTRADFEQLEPGTLAIVPTRGGAWRVVKVPPRGTEEGGAGGGQPDQR